MTSTGAAPGIGLIHGAATDTGQVRGHNEDAFGIDVDRGLFVVADGLGGHQAGEVASAVAVKRFMETVASGEGEPDAVVTTAVLEAHRAVRGAVEEMPQRAGMGTTLVAAWIRVMDARTWMVNVGDSRCFAFRDGVLAQISVDHTAVEELRRVGALSEDPTMWPPRQQLTQALGPADSVDPYVTSFDLEQGDRILLCSDGLTDMVSAAGIAHVLATQPDPQTACSDLIQGANRGGGVDNTTVVLVDVLASGPQEVGSE